MPACSPTRLHGTAPALSPTRAVGHAKGFFQGAKSIEFWVKTDQGKPQVAINIGVDQKGCQPQELKALPSAGEQNGWTKYAFSLGQVRYRQSQSTASACRQFLHPGLLQRD